MNILILLPNSDSPIYVRILLTITDLICIISLAIGFTTSITITDQFIKHKTIFKTVILDWSQINSYGVYIYIRGPRYILEKKDYQDFFRGTRLIFLTDIKEFTIDKYSLRNKNNTIFIEFGYRLEIIKLIEDKMNKLKTASA